MHQKHTTRAIKTQAKPVHQLSIWNDAPMRAKIMLLIAVAAVGGCIVGMLEIYMGQHFYNMASGLGGLCLFLFGLSKVWCWLPIEQLIKQLEQIDKTQRPKQIQSLPLHRVDEVGKIARVIHELMAWTIREHIQSLQLRKTFADEVSKAISRATADLTNMAMRDPLTGLGNRRFVDENLEELVRTAGLTQTDLVCITFDVDNFKQVNDTLGHAIGDELLIFIASLIQASVRGDDCPIRIGGDEFILLMPGCDMEHATRITQRMVVLFKQHCQSAFPAVPVSLSVGLASLNQDHPADGRALMELADTRLYDAKKTGKNKLISQ